ncbi:MULTISPECIES: hypothetical protein [unclassified Sporosarcina]|nr:MULTISPECIES: hypothetical protein [unclassified Sporosarcina]
MSNGVEFFHEGEELIIDEMASDDPNLQLQATIVIMDFRKKESSILNN